MQNDVTTVLFCLSCCHKKYSCTVILSVNVKLVIGSFLFSRYSLEHSLYTSDNGKGHYSYVQALSEALWQPQSEEMLNSVVPQSEETLNSVVRGKQMVESDFRVSLERTFYERDRKHIQNVFKNTPKLFRVRHWAKQAARIVTGKER